MSIYYIIAVALFTLIVFLVKRMTTKIHQNEASVGGKYEQWNIGIELCVGAVVAACLKAAHIATLMYSRNSTEDSILNNDRTELQRQSIDLITKTDSVSKLISDKSLAGFLDAHSDSIHQHMLCVDGVCVKHAQLIAVDGFDLVPYITFAGAGMVFLILMVHLEQERHGKMGARTQSPASGTLVFVNMLIGLVFHVVFATVVETHK